MSSLLMLLVLLFSLQPGRLQEEGTGVNVTVMLQSLEASIINLTQKTTRQSKEIKSLRADLRSLEVSLSNLSMSLQELKKKTTADIQQINSTLDMSTTNQQDSSPQTPIPTYTCGGTEGWRRAVNLDMTDPSTTCPSGWQLLIGNSKRTCGRTSDAMNVCDSAIFPVSGGEYSKVCGRIKAYQWGGTDAFQNYHIGLVTTIDGAYLDGVSLTRGRPRQHIWTFAAGLSEIHPLWQRTACPCDTNSTIRVPPFVGEDYFCESGVNEAWGFGTHRTLLANDTLWDGRDCLPSSSCCSLHDPPYFVKQLPTSTADDIEARICLNYGLFWENVAIELVELYVQ